MRREIQLHYKQYTVNSEIFAGVLISRNFAFSKFRGEMTKSHCRLLMKVKHALVAILLPPQICLLTLFAKIKFSRKFPDLQYRWTHTISMLVSVSSKNKRG